MIKEILKVFSEEYKKETKLYIFLERQINKFKLTDNSENIDDVVKRLNDKNFVSNFKIQ